MFRLVRLNNDFWHYWISQMKNNQQTKQLDLILYLPWLQHGTALAMETRRNRSPGFGQGDHRSGIKDAETE